jgi:Uma2 family endonuclease
MADPSTPRKLTYADFKRFPEDDRQRHEILDGVHVQSPNPWTRHQQVAGALLVQLHTFVRDHRLGTVLFPRFVVVLARHDIVVPDLFFVSKSREAILQENRVQGAPDLMVEIVGPDTRQRDLGAKRERYEQLGVLEYWVVDPEAVSVLVFRREKEAFLPPRQLRAEAGDSLTTPLLTGLEISLREVFEE